MKDSDLIKNIPHDDIPELIVDTIGAIIVGILIIIFLIL